MPTSQREQMNSEADNQNQNQEELIFGKNAVLAFLEQCDMEEPGDHKTVQNALVMDALEQAQRAAQSAKDEEIEALEGMIREAVSFLKCRQDIRLQLPTKPSFAPTKGIKVNKILLADGQDRDARVRKIKTLARHQHIPIHDCDRRKLDQLAGPQRRHQGVVAMISPAEMWRLDTFLQKLVLDRISRELSGQSMDGYMIALLDGVEDPHNLGAVIRVAEAAGVKALLLPQRRAAGLTGTVAKTSAGALATLPVVRVGNIVQCLETLKKYGFWVAALDLDGKELYTESNLVRPLVVVIGSEGQGVSRLVKEHCDLLLRIPMLGKTESLNASVAAGIMFYEVVRQCKFK
jgi:23S rRNA (guanosine2251-2'-O)-methyltransferase